MRATVAERLGNRVLQAATRQGVRVRVVSSRDRTSPVQVFTEVDVRGWTERQQMGLPAARRLHRALGEALAAYDNAAE